MADNDRHTTMLPLSRVSSQTVRSETLRDDLTRDDVSRPSGVVSSRVVAPSADVATLLPVMVEVLPSPVLVIDEQLRLVVANAAARRLLASTDAPCIGCSVGRFLSLEKLQQARITLLQRAGVHSYRDTVRVDEVEREIEIQLEFIETAGREFLCGTLTDESQVERERAEWADSQAASPPSARIDYARRLEALGHLTGSLAHDFNNLLSVILGSLETAERRVALGKDPLADLQRAKKATERSIQTTAEILRYARGNSVPLEPVSPQMLVNDLRGLIERALGESIRLVFEVASTRNVRVGPAQLETALLNLIINARDAIEEDGEIRVTLASRHLTASDATQLGLVEGEHVTLTVSDSGVGMTEDVKKRVFEPFYTTKPQGRGTGLGLSTVRSVAQKYGGAVVLDSEVGRGTQVQLLFPAV